MTAKKQSSKRGLGRGLDSLLSGSATVKTDSKVATIKKLSVNLLQRGQYQPRQNIATEPLQELADSIAKQGIIQPIVVRKLAGENYEIIAGERRWQAAKLANITKVPVVIRNVDDATAIAMSLIENIQRENLKPLEEASALQRLMQEFNLTQQKAADAVGKSRPAVANLLRLLNLPDFIKEMMSKGALEMGHARALLSLEDEDKNTIATIVATKNLTVRATEDLVKKTLNPLINKSIVKVIDPNIRQLQNDLEQTLGARVQLKHNESGKGSVTIQYNSLDELDGILTHIK